jgi:hypothetical protein
LKLLSDVAETVHTFLIYNWLRLMREEQLSIELRSVTVPDLWDMMAGFLPSECAPFVDMTDEPTFDCLSNPSSAA